MPMHRRRFRVEGQSISESIGADSGDSIMPMHSEIMAELRAIRSAMAAPHVPGAHAVADPVIAAQLAEAQTTIAAYRMQIEQSEKMRGELNLIHDAINRTKQEIAVLHGRSFSGDEMAKVTGELGAVVGGTEEATQQILEAAEAIDQAASAVEGVTSADQRKQLTEEIQERVVTIFEACNFQDLTGQRISKVMATMKFIEGHVNAMMDIWGGAEAIHAVAPVIADDRDEDARLLNGPKLGDEGHASQDDIDALFG